MFYGTGEMRELKPDLSDVMPGSKPIKVFERDASENGLLEGSRFIKHDGKYYLLMISWPRGGNVVRCATVPTTLQDRMKRKLSWRAISVASPT